MILVDVRIRGPSLAINSPNAYVINKNKPIIRRIINHSGALLFGIKME